MERRELICIGCPLGCSLTVSMEGAEVVSVTGNTCKRGDVYARKEVSQPNQDRDLHREGLQRNGRYGVCKDEGGRAEGEDL